MKYLLDTDIMSHLMRRAPTEKLLEHLRLTNAEDRCISSITLGELLYGAMRSDTPEKYLPAINL
jgi:tRNA(fMet)-specific endonuclease VapC